MRARASQLSARLALLVREMFALRMCRVEELGEFSSPPCHVTNDFHPGTESIDPVEDKRKLLRQ